MAPDEQSAVDPKTLSSVTEMLTTANADTVMQGIELVRSLDDGALCDALLEGVVYEPGDDEENGRLVPNDTFRGSDEEQPCLNLALLGLINHGTGATCTHFRETVTTLATNCPTTAVLSNLTKLERLTLGTGDEPIEELSEFGNLPHMTHLEFWGSDETVEVVKGGLSTCTGLRWLSLGESYDSGSEGIVFEAEEAGTDLLADPEVVHAALEQGSNALYYANEKLKTNHEIVLEAAYHDTWALDYAHDSLLSDRAFLLEAVKQQGADAESDDGRALEYADQKLKTDKEFIVEVVKQNGLALQYADDGLKADREVVLEAIKVDDKNRWVKYGASPLLYADDGLKADREIVLAAVKQDGMALQYADDSVKADREIALAAVRQNGYALKHADEGLKADREIVIEAVKEIRDALQYASEELQNDPELKKITEG